MDRDKKLARPSSSASAQDSEDAMPSIGPHNPALGEIYQRLYPEMRRPKPNQEAIAAALQAMQRLTMESDSEAAAEDATLDTTSSSHHACHVCGHHNRVGSKFCGMCGLPSEPRHPNRQIPHRPFTPCPLSTTRDAPQSPRAAPEASR